ncbi:glycosyltransferase family 2 protein [Actibacterium mucosum]|uniref:glycosyltransferase family 2 protein n=1 Tax=Actibacterium mucosum TaxID=1087332 RepID=UPI001F2027BE|nr:glycosyltransferase family 2 protein [Actibacterium mucosum]
MLFACVRNEEARLPYFLDYYRKMGVGHFLFVDNGSNDATSDILDAADISVWTTDQSYRLSRFGMDWVTWLQIKHGHGHWCLTVDADELLIYPYHETEDLHALTRRLDRDGKRSFGALMLDLYPKGRLSDAPYVPGEDPTQQLEWYDPTGYPTKYQPPLRNMLIRGGARGRVFFASEPERAPTLSKAPLVKWNRRFAYVSSTHSVLPRRLNNVRDPKDGKIPSGILLHTKFLNVVVEKSSEEKMRKEHFANSELYNTYYDAVSADPVLWFEGSAKLGSWHELQAHSLMSSGHWLPENTDLLDS